jgi:Zn-dependent protease with chaperone function
VIGLFEGTLLAGTLLAFATWACVAVLTPRVRWSEHVRPERREWQARAMLYAPAWIPVLLIGAALSPGVLAAITGAGDHCLLHGDSGHHPHLCILHPPHPSGSVIGVLVPLALFAPAALFLSLCVRRVRREWRLARTLIGLSRPSQFGTDVRLLDRSEPLAFTVGWHRPVVLLSTGLIEAVSDSTLQVVLAHERAHVARRDTWVAPFDRLAEALLPRRAATILGDRIVLAREQACDALAAQSAGGTIGVASALTDIVRLQITTPATGVSITSGDLEARVHQLMSPEPATSGSWLTPSIALACLLVVSARPVHTAIEHLVKFVLH